MSLYPTLDEERLQTFVADVPEDLWNDFKSYAYNGVPKAVEQPHRWNSTMEDFIFYIMEQWIKQHSEKQAQQLILFADAEEIKPGKKEWQQLLSLLDGELGEELRKVEFVAYNEKGILLKTSKAQRDKVESCLTDDVIKQVKTCSIKVFGKVVSWNYSLTDK